MNGTLKVFAATISFVLLTGIVACGSQTSKSSDTLASSSSNRGTVNLPSRTKVCFQEDGVYKLIKADRYVGVEAGECRVFNNSNKIRLGVDAIAFYPSGRKELIKSGTVAVIGG